MKQDKKNKDSKDVFEEALSVASEMVDSVESIQKDSLSEQALALTEENSDDWINLKKSIEGRHTKRFNRVLDELPDRDFVRAYLKSLEYFKPKTTRQDSSAQNNGDNHFTLNIIKTVKVIENGEETVDVSHVEIKNLTNK